MDSDEYGNPLVSMIGCGATLNYVLNNTDCDDSDSTIQNAVDIFYLDYDLDGFGDYLTTLVSCFQPEGYVSNQLDCDDLNNLITVPTLQFYQDLDLDGFGNSMIAAIDCFQPIGFVLDSTDCDDTNPLMYCNAVDLNGNGIDENCDGIDGYLLLVDKGSAIFNTTISLNNNFLKITLNNPMEVTLIRLIDLSGKEIYHNINLFPIDVSRINEGIYILQITSDSATNVQRIYLSK